jgi:hypothetical protein
MVMIFSLVYDSDTTDLIERIAKMSQQLENLTHVQSQTVKKNYACFYYGINGHIKRTVENLLGIKETIEEAGHTSLDAKYKWLTLCQLNN